MKMFRKILTGILFLILLLHGAAFAAAAGNGPDTPSFDLSFQSTEGMDIRIAEIRRKLLGFPATKWIPENI